MGSSTGSDHLYPESAGLKRYPEARFLQWAGDKIPKVSDVASVYDEVTSMLCLMSFWP